jgi:hypothetical protein
MMKTIITMKKIKGLIIKELNWIKQRIIQKRRKPAVKYFFKKYK